MFRCAYSICFLRCAGYFISLSFFDLLFIVVLLLLLVILVHPAFDDV